MKADGRASTGTIILRCIILAIAVGFFLFVAIKPMFDRADRHADAEKADATAKAHPTLISVEQLTTTYKRNAIAADKELVAAWLKIPGIIGQLGKDVIGRPFVLLNGGVQCVFSDSHANELLLLQVGQQITVLGKCDGMTLGLIEMSDCQLAN